MAFFNVLPGTGVVFLSLFSFFFLVGVVCHKEGEMQLLGWTVVLLFQWIPRKVSFSAPQTKERRVVRRHVHIIPESAFVRN